MKVWNNGKFVEVEIGQRVLVVPSMSCPDESLKIKTKPA